MSGADGHSGRPRHAIMTSWRRLAQHQPLRRCRRWTEASSASCRRMYLQSPANPPSLQRSRGLSGAASVGPIAIDQLTAMRRQGWERCGLAPRPSITTGSTTHIRASRYVVAKFKDRHRPPYAQRLTLRVACQSSSGRTFHRPTNAAAASSSRAANS